MRLRRTLSIKLLPLVLISSWSCTKDFDPIQKSFPLIQTTPVTNIDDTGAQFNAQVIKTGTDPVIDFGFMYVERPNTLFKTVPDTFSVSMGTDFGNNFSMKVNHNLNKYVSYKVMAYAVTTNKKIISNIVVFKSMSTSPIYIKSFNPADVLDGDTLTINGENFNRYGSDYVLLGNQLLKDVLFYNNASVIVRVPPIAQTGRINVTVDAFYAKTNSDQLIIINPSITSFSPTHGSAGVAVALNGRFSSNIDYNKIFFNGVASNISFSTRNQIITTLPSGLSGNVSITINVNGKTFTTSDTFLVE